MVVPPHLAISNVRNRGQAVTADVTGFALPRRLVCAGCISTPLPALPTHCRCPMNPAGALPSPTDLLRTLPLLAFGTHIEYHRPHEHTTPIPHTHHPPPRSPRRPPDHPAPCHPLSRRPWLGPSSTQAASPTVAPRPPVPPNPPSPRLPTRPSHPVRIAPSTYPNWPKSNAPPPSRVFWKKLLRAQGAPSSAPQIHSESTLPTHPRHPAPPRPTVTLTPRTPKAREGLADGRRNHRSRG